MSDVVSCLLSNYLLHSRLSPSHICLLRLWTHLTLLFFLVLFLNRQPSHWFGKIPFAPQCKPYGPMIACRLRTFAKCQRPKSGDNTEEGWRGLEREPFYIHINTYMLTECRTNIKMCITAPDASSQDHLTLTSLWSLIYTTCSLFIGPIQFSGVCLLFSWLRRFCLYLSAFHQANSPDLAHVHLAICKQSKIGCGLISRYWIFWRTNTLLLTKGQKHHKGLRESVCISAKGLYLPCWLNKTLTWMILSAPFTYFDRKKRIFPVCNSHHQSFNLWSLPLFIYYRSYICSDMKTLLILASVLPCVHTCAV